MKIPADFRINVGQGESTVHAETAGRLTEIFAREGVRVRKGDLLARTEDYTKKSDIERITGELQERQRTLERLQAPPRPEEIRQLETRIASKKTELTNVRRNEEERNRLAEVVLKRKKHTGFS